MIRFAFRQPRRVLLGWACLLAIGSATVAHAQIVAFGASNVAGRGVLPFQAWPAQLENLLKGKGLNIHVKNAGISGETTSHMLQRVDSAVPNGTKLVILDMSGGIYNNSKFNVSQAQGEADMREIAARLKGRGIAVLPESTKSMPQSLRQSDHVHLTATGHHAFAEQMLPRVISALNGAHAG